MRFPKLLGLAVIALALPLLSILSVAQATPAGHAKHHHYKLVDVGTFGGPNSGTENPASLELNNLGMSVGVSDTPAPDPYAPDCFLDCYVDLGFWQVGGFVTPLGPLPGGVSSFAYAINDSGWIVGQAQNGAVDELTGYPVAHAVLWRQGQINDLGTLGGTQPPVNWRSSRSLHNKRTSSPEWDSGRYMPTLSSS